MPHPQVKGLVSVIIPVYNAASHAGETLHSVFAQTYRDFEAIVADDGSTDTSELQRVLRPFSDRLIYMSQTNQGPAAARNLGLSVARGEFCAFLDSDDIWFPNYLSEQVAMLRHSPGTDAFYCDSALFGDEALAGLSFMDGCPSTGPVSLKSLISEKTVVQLSFCVLRRERILQVGGFDPNLRACEDFDLWVRMCAAGARFGYGRKILGLRRVHAGSLSSDYERMISGRIEVYRKLGQTLQTTESADAASREIDRCRALLAVYRAKQYIRDGQVARAVALLRQQPLSGSLRARAALRLGQVSPATLRFALRMLESRYIVAARLAWCKFRARISRVRLPALQGDYLQEG